jgi:hypothetical protein|nr:MAG TPA: hypothetical protein [Caudoviricetes sp.]
MSFQLLPTDYKDISFTGNRKYNKIQNDDGTISFQDVTVYQNRDKAFFGADTANKMNGALNTIMTALEHGTDLYGEFQNFFEKQKGEFRKGADANLDELKVIMETYQNKQKLIFETWFDLVKKNLSESPVGHLQNEMEEVKTDNERLMKTFNEVIVTIPASGWTNTAPYSNKVTVAGVTNEDDIILGKATDKNSTAEQVELWGELSSLISSAVVGTGYVTFYSATERPTKDFKVKLKGVSK